MLLLGTESVLSYAMSGTVVAVCTKSFNARADQPAWQSGGGSASAEPQDARDSRQPLSVDPDQRCRVTSDIECSDGGGCFGRGVYAGDVWVVLDRV
eukprot:2417351-Rhodomonas_salina.5